MCHLFMLSCTKLYLDFFLDGTASSVYLGFFGLEVVVMSCSTL